MASWKNNFFQVRHWKKLVFGFALQHLRMANFMLHAPELGNQEASSLPWKKKTMVILRRPLTLFSRKFYWTTEVSVKVGCVGTYYYHSISSYLIKSIWHLLYRSYFEILLTQPFRKVTIKKKFIAYFHFHSKVFLYLSTYE